MDTENFVFKAIFIITLSTVFPMIGYYLDYRSKKKRFKGKTNTMSNSIDKNV